MPELPEVTIVVNDLNHSVTGLRISEIIVSNAKRVFPNKNKLAAGLSGRIIVSAARVGKNICLELDNSEYLIFHLAMTGRLLLKGEPGKERWEKIRVKLELPKGTGSGNKRQDGSPPAGIGESSHRGNTSLYLVFTDVRTFGKTQYYSAEEIKRLRDKYGPDPISSSLTPETFFSRINKKQTNIKTVLLDQKVISGLGNIYTTEALFLSGIHPQKPARDISPGLAETLLNSIIKVLRDGISHRGSSLEDKMYVDLYGNPGTHQNHFLVYGRKFCNSCGTKISYIKLNGRGTYFCPRCQPHENK